VIERLVSGGQTGVDRATLDVARELGLDCGGWCPRGRRAEDGPIDERYPLRETPSARYSQRTDWNVRDSDATLILARGTLRGGTALTARLARRREKPVLVVDPAAAARPHTVSQTLSWLERHAVRTLNVAGPRGTDDPAIGRDAADFLRALLRAPTVRGR